MSSNRRTHSVEVPSPSDRLEVGEAVRREVLGDEHVDRSMASETEFSASLHSLVTEYCWGAVWSRDGLDRQTRSLINVAMLTALNRPREVTLHVKGALRNGCTVTQIQETLLQAAIYCGVPAALSASRAAQEAIDEAHLADS